MLAGFMQALELQDVTLYANDTGGAISQITAANHPERIGGWCSPTATRSRTSCRRRSARCSGREKVPGMLNATLQGMRFKALRRLPIAYGWLIKRDFDAPTREWVDPFLADRGIRRDTVKVLKGIDPRYTIEAAEKLRDFERPALLAWAVEDRFFKASYAERLAETIRGATLERTTTPTPWSRRTSPSAWPR